MFLLLEQLDQPFIFLFLPFQICLQLSDIGGQSAVDFFYLTALHLKLFLGFVEIFQPVEGRNTAILNSSSAEIAINQLSFFVFAFEHIFDAQWAGSVLGHAHDHWAAFFLIEFFSADGTLEPIIFLVHVKDIYIYILATFLGIG